LKVNFPTWTQALGVEDSLLEDQYSKNMPKANEDGAMYGG